MALSDITSAAIRAACAEYDAIGASEFLRKHGFGPALRYELVLDGKRYDSKAIVGVAHGFLGAGFEPLKSSTFNGGVTAAVKVLEQLGFEVEDKAPAKNPDWTRDELILATEFYKRFAPKIPGKTSRAIIELSDEIRAVATIQGLFGKDTFRNANGVYMKLGELKKYDDAYTGKGLGHEKLRDIELEAFTLPDTDLLLLARDIRRRIAEFLAKGGEVPPQRRPQPSSKVLRSLLASDDPVESQLAETLMEWQEAKRGEGRSATLGREPGQINQNGAVSVIEGRVRSRSSGFDEVSATNQSYERIVVENPDRFSPDVVEIARERLAEFELAMPTDNREELDNKSRALLDHPNLLQEPPAGSTRPRKELSTGVTFVRDPRVVAYTQLRANGVCELCKEQAPFLRSDGTPYLETHHVIPLAEGGPDTVQNCVAVCPNCHRALHSANNRAELTAKFAQSSS